MTDAQCNHQRIVFIASTGDLLHRWYGCDDCGFVFEVAAHAMVLPERAVEYLPPHAPRPSDPVELMMARARGAYPETVAEKVAKFQPRSCGTGLSQAQLALVDLAEAASLLIEEWDPFKSEVETIAEEYDGYKPRLDCVSEAFERLRARLTEPHVMAAVRAASPLRPSR